MPQSKGCQLLQLRMLSVIEAVLSERVTEASVFESPGKKKKSKHSTAEQLAKVLSQLAKQSLLSDTTDMGGNRKSTH